MLNGPLFTVWSDGELVGATALDYIANTSEVKFGDFTATEFGERAIAIRMSLRKALCARAPLDEIEALHACREAVPLELRAPDGRVISTDDIEITDLDWLLTLASRNEEEDDWESDVKLAEFELQEELDPDEGECEPLIPPELLESDENDFAFEDLDLSDADEGDPDAPPRQFPRYQIQVRVSHGG